jgi:hypothetical protein
MRTYALALGLAAALVCNGCSYAFMRPAPAHPEQMEWVDCTSSRVAPVADGVGVVEGIGMALAIEVLASLDADADDDIGTEARVMQVASLGVAGVYLASAIYGFRSAEDCEHAKALSNLHQLEQVKAAELASPTAMAPAPPPGCQGDAECKGGRRCVAGSCTWPQPIPVMPTAAPPAPVPTPAASPLAPGP